MPGKHATLSASSAHRWLACTPSVRLEKHFPDTSSSHAEEGTLAHEYAALELENLLGRIKPDRYKAQHAELAKHPMANGEMQEYALAYADYVMALLEETRAVCPDARVFVEQRLKFDEWVPKGYGTADCAIVADDLLTVIDFKYGKGVRVDAKENPQMRLYALGAWGELGMLYDVRRVRTIIYQPRISEIPSEEEVPLGHLEHWAITYVKPRAAMAYNGEGDYCPGEHTCKFCKARETCAARAQALVDLFDEAPPDTLPMLTLQQLGKLLEKAGDMRNWLSDIEGRVFGALADGEAVPGWKLVEGSSNRKLGDEKKVEAALVAAGIDRAKLYTEKMIPLTRMEKDFGKKAVTEVLGGAGLITKPPGKPILAKATDPRKEITAREALMDAFDEA